MHKNLANYAQYVLELCMQFFKLCKNYTRLLIYSYVLYLHKKQYMLLTLYNAKNDKHSV